MASANMIFVAIIILGIIYMYINSRQYLVREGFAYNKKEWRKQKCESTINRKYCSPNCIMYDKLWINGKYVIDKNKKKCNVEHNKDCVKHWMECKK